MRFSAQYAREGADMAERGRPTAYTPELAAEICERMAAGESLRSICRSEDMPSEITVRRWAIENREGFSAQYAMASETRMDCLADEIVEIADDKSGDPGSRSPAPRYPQVAHVEDRPEAFWRQADPLGRSRRAARRREGRRRVRQGQGLGAMLAIPERRSNRIQLHIKVNEVFEPLFQPARYKGAYGGRGSGKSWCFAEMLVQRCIVEPGTAAVCIREVQRTLTQSSKRLIESKIQQLGVGPLFRVLDDRIETPGDGLIIFQGMQDHTAESIKSLEGFRIAWIEEAQTLSHRSLALLRPTIRVEGSEIWAVWNPRRKSDAIDEFFRQRKAGRRYCRRGQLASQ